MATHSSILAWKIPWTEEPGGLQSIESRRCRHDRSDITYTHIFILMVVLIMMCDFNNYICDENSIKCANAT